MAWATPSICSTSGSRETISVYLPDLVLGAVRTKRSRAHGVRARNLARAFWWGARGALITPPGLKTTMDLAEKNLLNSLLYCLEKDDSFFQFDFSRALQATNYQLDVLIHSFPSSSDQDETRLLDCTRALAATIHQLLGHFAHAKTDSFAIEGDGAVQLFGCYLSLFSVCVFPFLLRTVRTKRHPDFAMSAWHSVHRRRALRPLRV